MTTFMKKLWNDKRGNVLIIGAATLPMLVGAAGLATDTIQWTMWKRQLQRAADSAAIAGVYDRVANDHATTNTVAAVNHDLDLNNHTVAGDGSTGLLSKQVSYPPNPVSGALTDQVMVTLRVQKKLPFSSLFLSAAPIVVVNATAASVPGPGDPCVHSLDESGAKNDIGINITGDADIDMPDCILHSNGSSSNSAVAKGSAKVKAEAASAVGGIEQSDNWDIESYRPYSAKVEDPYATVKPYNSPSEMKCAVTSSTDKKGNITYTPVALTDTTDVANAKDVNGEKANCFSSLDVGSGGNLSLDSGTYYINGGSAFIQGDMTCTKCTIVLTNKSESPTATIGDFKVNADAKINMTAPNSGNFKGIAIYQDRRAGGGSNKINGNSGSIIQGSLYFPKQELDYNGGGTTEALCTRFVAFRVKFSGNSAVSNKFKSASQCAEYGPPDTPAGAVRVRLVA